MIHEHRHPRSTCQWDLALHACDQATDEYDVISSAQKRRRLTHKSIVSARFFPVILMRTMLCRFKQIVLCPLLPKILMRSARDLLPALFTQTLNLRGPPSSFFLTWLERLALLVLLAIYFQLPWRRVVNLVSPSLEDTSTSSSSSRREMTPPSCPLCLKPMIRRQNRVKGNFWGCQRNPTELVVLGKWAKTKSLQHDEVALVDSCSSSTLGFLMY